MVVYERLMERISWEIAHSAAEATVVIPRESGDFSVVPAKRTK
jgi:hypothetical protein